MGRYLHLFGTEDEFNSARGNNYKEPWVSYTEENTEVIYNKTEEEKEKEKELQTPLTFEIQSDGRIIWKTTSTAFTRTLEYSKDNGNTWNQVTSTKNGVAIPVVSGDIVQFRGNNTVLGSGYIDYNCFSGTTCQFAIKGNIMSLLDSTNFSTMTALQGEFTFNYLFSDCTGLTDASNLLLPATTLARWCYFGMFCRCTSLTTVPELPATTLADYCYLQMFDSCTSLTQVPELPATTLGEGCYNSMFYGCSGLITVPSNYLPVTTLVNNCYQRMFQGCTSLIQAPELPATTLTRACYQYIFQGCTSLNYIKCLATDISATWCTGNWVQGVASTGTFVKAASMARWGRGSDGIPSGWTVQDAA